MSAPCFPPMTGDVDESYLFDGSLRQRGCLSLADRSAYGVHKRSADFGEALTKATHGHTARPSFVSHVQTAIMPTLKSMPSVLRGGRVPSEVSASGIAAPGGSEPRSPAIVSAFKGACQKPKAHVPTPDRAQDFVRIKVRSERAEISAIFKSGRVFACIRRQEEAVGD